MDAYINSISGAAITSSSAARISNKKKSSVVEFLMSITGIEYNYVNISLLVISSIIILVLLYASNNGTTDDISSVASDSVPGSNASSSVAITSNEVATSNTNNLTVEDRREVFSEDYSVPATELPVTKLLETSSLEAEVLATESPETSSLEAEVLDDSVPEEINIYTDEVVDNGDKVLEASSLEALLLEIDNDTYYSLISRSVYPVVKNSSKGETMCRNILENLFGLRFDRIRPSFLTNPETGRRLELDCYNAKIKLAVEYNGEQHYIWPNHVNMTYKQFINQVRRDRYKKRVCSKIGIDLIVIRYDSDIITSILRSIPVRLIGYICSKYRHIYNSP